MKSLLLLVWVLGLSYWLSATNGFVQILILAAWAIAVYLTVKEVTKD